MQGVLPVINVPATFQIGPYLGKKAGWRVGRAIAKGMPVSFCGTLAEKPRQP